MIQHTLAFSMAALSFALGTGFAHAASLAPQRERISDEAIYRDHSTYQATQDRIQALNDGGRPVRDYALSKAQCWLDVSFHEYTRNDRSDFPQAALDESERLIVAMEQGVSPIPTDTPLVNGAARLREDLWKRLGAIHGTPGFVCAQQAVACGEVELVHAGNEFNQQQWRHAKPYIQIAEDTVADAEALARTCGNGRSTPAGPSSLTANVLFEFDRRGLADVREHSLGTLDRALARVREEHLTIAAVRLIGHADRMQGRGFDYNQALSRDRAETVKAYLVGQGIDAALVSYEYRGDTEQVQSCEGVRDRAALHECLLPNRRVEVKFEVAE
ncbi:OmpA family protein [Lysobacter arvi]|uniref:OmpA family protein n=1 Tax=Lysobacter arvi TaxID=3038776 RepID=A0ABU1CCA9_9GAMM|nr:OmpA family protein [Lysobacter arvi]MDR0182049.1 OmpA family protein [Lysobacter arvi]